MPEGSMRRRVPIASIALLLVLLVSVHSPAGAQGGNAGMIRGQLFTAQHPESVAAGAELTLIFRNPGSEVVERTVTRAGQDGTYLFAPVSTDPAIAYVIKVHHFGRDYLGAPMSFEPGSALLEFNFLVARDAAPIPQTEDAHPPMGGALDAHTHPPVQPVRQDPIAAAAIVLGVLTLFALPFLLDRSRSGDGPGKIEGSAADLMRDIASLDLRFADGDLEEPEYRAVRERLFAKLEERTGVSRPDARRAR